MLPFKQSDSSRCGPAVIKMVLGYYGVDALEEEICKRCELTYELGCTDIQMKKAIESFGFGCSIFNNSTLGDIEYWIRHHIPIIVDWFTPGINPGLEDMPNGHSSIVVGIDRERVYLLDPEIGAVRSVAREEFMRVWFDWRKDPVITSWDDMVVRQMIITYPKRLIF